jgi:signal transduction histidine kinase
LELPGLSGLDLQQELAKADVQIPIIFLTGRADISTSVRAMKAGLDFLTKPIDDEVLMDAIRRGIAHYQARWQQCRGTLPSFVTIDDVRLEERVKERTRIAHELHDTLLQSFQGLMCRFQTADYLLPARPGEAKQTLESAIDDAAQAITEARDAVHELRSSTTVSNDLPAVVTALGKELAAPHATDSQNSPAFLVEVEGRPRDLQPLLQDEIYRIAREAIGNAFRHAKARRIETEIHYSDKVLRLRIRDDGRGMDPGIVEEGLIGHYGLRGMCERATQIGGQLSVWSGTGTGSGTEIELKIPGSIAYGTGSARTRWWRRLQLLG